MSFEFIKECLQIAVGFTGLVGIWLIIYIIYKDAVKGK